MILARHLPPLLVLICGAAALALFPRWTVDDAYIYYRYADNWARLGSPLWNPGEDPVEGYTGVLLPAALALGRRLADLNPLPLSKAIGLTAWFCLAAAVWLWLRSMRIREPLRSAAFALTLLAPLHFTHAWSGLETMWFSAGVAATFWLMTARLESLIPLIEPPASPDFGSAPPHAPFQIPIPLLETALALVLLMVALLRPEGAVLAAIVCAAIAFAHWRRAATPRACTRWLLTFALLFVLPGSLYFLWRWQFFGHPLPNTFYAKGSSGSLEPRTLDSLIAFTRSYLFFPAAAVALLAPLVQKNRRKSPAQTQPENPPTATDSDPSTAAGLASLAVVSSAAALHLALICLQYLHSSPVMNFQHRFFAPYLPVVIALLAGHAERALRLRNSQHQPRPAIHWRFGVLAVLLVQLSIYAWIAPQAWSEARRYQIVLEDVHRRAGAFLRRNVPPDEWLVVYLDAGVIPYESGLKTVDFGGLNDESLAHGRLDEPARLDYLFAHRPGAIVFTSRSWDRVDYLPETARIQNDPRFRNYELAAKFRTRRTRIRAADYQFIYLRRDLLKDQPS